MLIKASVGSPEGRRPAHDSAAQEAEARLALAEALLVRAPALEASAATTLSWLARHAGVGRALVLVSGQGGLRLAAAIGVDLDARVEQALAGATSLSAALEREGPRALVAAASAALLATPLAGAPLLAVPLRREERPRPLGLLLVEQAHDPDLPPPPRVEWAARLLATRLACLGGAAPPASEAPAGGMLRALIDVVPDPIVVTDREARIRVANAAAERLLVGEQGAGEGAQRAVGLNQMLFTSCLPADDRPRVTRRELGLVDPVAGQEQLFELISAPLEDPALGDGLVCVLHDVTDLHEAMAEVQRNCRKLRAAEALVRSERDRLDLIINAVADPVLVTQPDGRTVLLNSPAARLFTTDGAEEGGTERWVRANDAVLSTFLANLNTRRTLRWRGELELTDPETASPLPVEALAGKVIGAEGEDVAVVTILHDRREAQERALLYERVKRHSEELERRVQEATAELLEHNELLRRQAMELEQAYQTKSQFLASISHELRTPLQSIIGYTRLLLRSLPEGAPATWRTKLDRVDTNSRHLLGLIDDLLDIARIEAGRMPVRQEEVSVVEVVEEVVRELEPLVTPGRVRLRRRLEPGLRPVRTDRKKLKQVLLNLLSNALKFTPEGLVMVQAELDAATGEVVLEVADTGIGIAPEDQARIFEDFEQADSSLTRHYGGTGLGLSICRRLVALLGGTLSLVSRVGAGSTFTVRLPLGGAVAAGAAT